MQSLISEYKQSLKELRMMLRNIESSLKFSPDEHLKQDKSLINGMIDEMQYAIQWMESGRNPNNYRGADRTLVYIMEPALLAEIVQEPIQAAEGKPLTEEERFLIEDALADLSKREREVFILIKAEKFSFGATAELLGVSKASVQTFLARAEKKIEGRKAGSLFQVS